MFPNVRLMAAAMLASVVALSCGFGMFAAFRVNHDPLVRLPPGVMPYQLVSETIVPPAATFSAAPSFAPPRSPLDQTSTAGAAANPSAPKLDSGAGVGPPPDIVAADQKPAEETPDPSPAATASIAPVSGAPATPLAAGSSEPVAAVPVTPVDSTDIPGQAAKNQPPPAASASAPSEVSAVEAPPPQEAVQESKPEEGASAAAAPSDDAGTAETHAAKVYPVERKIVRRRIVHARPASAAGQAGAQPSSFGTFPQYPMANGQAAQPTSFGEQPARPEKRRIVLKVVSRRAPAKPAAKTAPAGQSAAGGPFVPAPAQ